jgi:hypothetical protein
MSENWLGEEAAIVRIRHAAVGGKWDCITALLPGHTGDRLRIPELKMGYQLEVLGVRNGQGLSVFG